MSLPTLLPLFPLPNVVLFPHVLLPLHIFEPRYREMVKDVESGEGLIGMILLRGPEDGSGRDLYTMGCAGRMIRRVPLADGRSNILLQGVREFVPREQYFDRPYRTGTVEWIPPAGEFRLEAERRRRLVARIRGYVGESAVPELRILDDRTVTDELLVNLFSFALDLPFAEKQALLESTDLAERAARLLETLDFHVLARGYAPSDPDGKPRVQ